MKAERSKGIKESVLEKCSSGTKLEELIQDLDAELHYGRDRILARVMEMKEKEEIELVEGTPYKSLASFILSPYSLWFWGVVVSSLLSLALIAVTSGVAIYLRYVFGGLVVMFLPGYSLIELLYAKKKELDDLVRVALSIGLSLALVPLAGLVLNYTPFGIRLVPVAVSLAGICIMLSLLAARRKHEYYKLERDVDLSG